MSGGIDDFLDLMPSTFQIEPYLGRDTYGVASYGSPPATYRGHKSDKTHFIRGPSGEQIVARGTAWLATYGAVISVEDRLTLPDGTQPKILDVNGGDDETGATLYTRLDLG